MQNPSPLRVLLVNSMPDGALQRTEQQFRSFLDAGPEFGIEFSLTTLPEIGRADWGRAHVSEHYIGLDRALARGTDVVVLTGTEPQREHLEDEPYWGSLTRILDWADANAVPALLSCLAAHAAVQHFDDIRRVRLDRKCTGLFEHHKTSDDPLLSELPASIVVPHSRWNEIREPALTQAGYRILTRSPEAGVDLFLREGRSRWLLFQGHPEYAAENLWREYQRDVRRYLDFQQTAYPDLPHGLGSADDGSLAAFQRRVAKERHGDMIALLPGVTVPKLPVTSPVNAVIRRWFAEIQAKLTGRFDAGAKTG